VPLTEKGKKILSRMQSEYGGEKGKQVFYASANKGSISGVHGDVRDVDDPNAVRLMGPFNPPAAATPSHSIDPVHPQDNLVSGTGELAGEIVKVLPDNVSVASINEANRKFWRSAGGEQT